MKRRRRNPLLALLLGGSLLASTTEAQDVDPLRYAIVKAGYVLNLLRLTQWPDATFATEESPLVVRVVGDDAMTTYLEQVVRGERIGNRPVLVERLSLRQGGSNGAALDGAEQLADALRGAHLVFVAADARPHLRSILAAVAPHPVLTVSDIPAFAADGGGMVGLAVRGGTVGLEANVPRLEQSGVSVSARVLQLARIVNE